METDLALYLNGNLVEGDKIISLLLHKLSLLFQLQQAMQEPAWVGVITLEYPIQNYSNCSLLSISRRTMDNLSCKLM